MGRFKLHLDGQAQDFWPDKGDWQWRYWGNGRLPPLQAAWDVAGSGRWQDSELVLDKLSTGFDKLKYGLVTVAAPRLSLNQPLRWRRDEQNPQFNGELQLAADKLQRRRPSAGAGAGAAAERPFAGQFPAAGQTAGAADRADRCAAAGTANACVAKAGGRNSR